MRENIRTRQGGMNDRITVLVLLELVSCLELFLTL